MQTLLAYSHQYKSRSWHEKIKIVFMLKHWCLFSWLIKTIDVENLYIDVSTYIYFYTTIDVLKIFISYATKTHWYLLRSERIRLKHAANSSYNTDKHWILENYFHLHRVYTTAAKYVKCIDGVFRRVTITFSQNSIKNFDICVYVECRSYSGFAVMVYRYFFPRENTFYDGCI